MGDVASFVALLQNMVDEVGLHIDRGRITRVAIPGAGRQRPSPQGDISRNERKPEADLREMRIGGEHLHDVPFLHDHHGRQISEGDVGFVVELLPQRPGPHKSIRRYPLDTQMSQRRGGENPLHCRRRR